MLLKIYLMFKIELYCIKCTIISFPSRTKFFLHQLILFYGYVTHLLLNRNFSYFFYCRHLYKFSLYIESDGTLPNIILGCKCICFQSHETFSINILNLFICQLVHQGNTSMCLEIISTSL